jgi:hypothetical protein
VLKSRKNHWKFLELWNLIMANNLIVTPYCKENKFLAKEDQNFEFLLKMEFGLISQWFEI